MLILQIWREEIKSLDKRLRILLLLVLLGFNLFYGLGGIPLLDPDEPVYAETAREMIQFNHNVTPFKNSNSTHIIPNVSLDNL